MDAIIQFSNYYLDIFFSLELICLYFSMSSKYGCPNGVLPTSSSSLTPSISESTSITPSPTKSYSKSITPSISNSETSTPSAISYDTYYSKEYSLSLSGESKYFTVNLHDGHAKLTSIGICQDIVASNNLNSIYFTLMDNDDISCNCVDISKLNNGDCVYYNSDDTNNQFCSLNTIAFLISFDNNILPCGMGDIYPVSSYDFSDSVENFHTDFNSPETFSKSSKSYHESSNLYWNTQNFVNMILNISTITHYNPTKDYNYKSSNVGSSRIDYYNDHCVCSLSDSSSTQQNPNGSPNDDSSSKWIWIIITILIVSIIIVLLIGIPTYYKRNEIQAFFNRKLLKKDYEHIQ